MGHYQKLIAEMLKSIIHCNESGIADLSGIDLDILFSECATHQVHTLVYPLIKKYSKNISLKNKKNLMIWEKNVIKDAAVQMQNCRFAYEILRKLDDSQIPVISLKGLILRELYPFPELRTMGDIDLLVKKEDLQKTGEILIDLNFYKIDSDEKHSVFENGTRLIIEVHTALTADTGSSAMDEFVKEVWKAARIHKYDKNTTLLILSDLHQILYLCQHMADHMCKEGFGLRQLCDLGIYIENYGRSIDWAEFYRAAGQLGVGSFSKAVIAVCSGLFEMKCGPDCTFNKDIDKEFVERLENDIFSSGVFGNKSVDRAMGNRLLRYSGKSSNESVGERAKSLLFLAFPPPSRLASSYSYARRNFILVPVAWTHRLFYAVFRRDLSIRDKSMTSFSKSAREAYNERSKLLNWLGLK